MDNFESVIPEKNESSLAKSTEEKAGEKEQMLTPVEKKNEEMPVAPVAGKTKRNNTNIFMAVLISVVIILLLSVAGWFLARKYIWQPQQSYVANQFETLEIKIQDLTADLEAERLAGAETMESLEEMKTYLDELKEEKSAEVERQANLPEDWVYYSNDDFAIEFYHPANWEIIMNDDLLSSKIEFRTDDTDELVANQEIFPGYLNNMLLEMKDEMAFYEILNKETGEVFTNLEDLLLADNREISVPWTFIDQMEINNYSAHVYQEGGYGTIPGVIMDVDGKVYNFHFERGGETLNDEALMVLNSIRFIK